MDVAEFAAKVQAALGPNGAVRQLQRKTVLFILGTEASVTAKKSEIITRAESEAKVLKLSRPGAVGSDTNSELHLTVEQL